MFLERKGDIFICRFAGLLSDGRVVIGARCLGLARRALAPRIRLAPGYIRFQPQLPPSDARSLFQAMTSQMPGTIPSGTESSGAIAYHCLDASLPVAEQLAEEEAHLLAALGGALGSSAVDGNGQGRA